MLSEVNYTIPTVLRTYRARPVRDAMKLGAADYTAFRLYMHSRLVQDDFPHRTYHFPTDSFLVQCFLYYKRSYEVQVSFGV